MDFFQVSTYYNFPNFSLIEKYKSGLLMKIYKYYQKPILQFLTFSDNKFRKPRLLYINYTSPTSKYFKKIFMITVLTHISLGTYFETSYLVFSNFWLRQLNLLFLHFTMKILRYFYLLRLSAILILVQENDFVTGWFLSKSNFLMRDLRQRY